MKEAKPKFEDAKRDAQEVTQKMTEAVADFEMKTFA